MKSQYKSLIKSSRESWNCWLENFPNQLLLKQLKAADEVAVEEPAKKKKKKKAENAEPVA